MKDLNRVSSEEQRSFFDSFDYAFTDIDGTLWMVLEPIPGANDGVRSLQKLGKTVGTISNNTLTPIETLDKNLKSAGFNIGKENIATPSEAIVTYLKEIKFDQELYAVTMAPLKALLKESGFKLVDTKFNRFVESVKDFALATFVDDDTKVGAVIYDIDFNQNYIVLQKAASFLQKPGVLFLAGAPDKTGPLGRNNRIVGPGHFQEILEDMSGKKPVVLAKPSKQFGQHLIEKFKIKDKSRALIVGDSIPEDMAMAANSGFKKLLVLSGRSNKNDVMNWNYPEEYKPDYYVDSLGTVHNIIKQIFPEVINNE